MSEIFQVSDLLNSMVRLEKTGHDFYTKMAVESADAKISSFFHFLADEEKKHEKTYTNLSNEYKNGLSIDETLDDNYKSYLNVLIRQNFAFDNLKRPTLKEALKFSISLEKDTLLYINEIQTIFKNEKADVFSRIKQEEESHLKMLSEYSQKNL
ncbi:ferritin-like domain-containing protein [Pectinatus frisingensis]|uniref:ferritin-like domain-containing protein n=1 Tax=Pectinatus frisingensis TaxID=865 RepID=UPI0018C54BF1|nr:ferritin family protein [Pectinatus frisingensis]